MADVVVVAETLDRRFVLLSSGAVLVQRQENGTGTGTYDRLRVGRGAQTAVLRTVFERWPSSKAATAAQAHLLSIESRHRTEVARSMTLEYKRKQGTGPMPMRRGRLHYTKGIPCGT